MSAGQHRRVFVFLLALIPLAMGANGSSCAPGGLADPPAALQEHSNERLSLTLPRRAAPPQPYLNLLDFGANASGAPGTEAANLEAFRAALSQLCLLPAGPAALARCSGVIWLPPGTYLMNRGLVLTDDVTIMGSGWSTEILWDGPMSSPENGGVQPILFNFVGDPASPVNGGFRQNAGITNLYIASRTYVATRARPTGDPTTLAVAIAWGPQSQAGLGERTPAQGYVSRVFVAGFGIGLLAGTELAAFPASDYGRLGDAQEFFVEDCSFRDNVIGVYHNGNGNVYRDLDIAENRIGVLLENGYNNDFQGGGIQGNTAGILIVGGWNNRFESMDFEANGGEFAEGCPDSTGTPQGGDVIVNPLDGFIGDGVVGGGATRTLAFVGLNFNDTARICDPPAAARGTGNSCPIVDVHFENVFGSEIDASPECLSNKTSFAETLSIVGGGSYLKRLTKAGETEPAHATVFNADGARPDGMPSAQAGTEAYSAFRILDDGSVEMGADANVPPTAKVNLLGLDKPCANRPEGMYVNGVLSAGESCPEGPSPFHAMDLVHAGFGTPGDSIGLRFEVNGQSRLAQGGDSEASSMIEVVNTGTSDGDMLFSTMGSQRLQERVRIDHDGRVGIGTSNPQKTLDVNGTLNVSGAVTIDAPLTKGIVALSDGAARTTVTAASTCFCTDVTAPNPVACSVSGATLTVAGAGHDQVAYLCL